MSDIRRNTQRGRSGGLLPGGFDANSIAAQAVIELFQPSEDTTGESHADQTFLSEDSHEFSLSTPLQTTIPETTLSALDESPEVQEAAMPKGWESDCRKLREELHRRVRRQVNRLWHLKERLVMHNLEDLAPVQTHDGETMNFLDALPNSDAGPQESLVHQEDRANEQQFQEQFHAFLARGRPARFLGNRRALQTLYACLCAGVSSRQELARELKVTPRVIKNRLRCLQRRAAAFSRLNPSERIQKGAKKVALQILHLQGLAEAA